MEKFLNIKFFVALTFIGHGLCDQVVFYDAQNYQGGTLTLSIESGCYNLKQRWETSVASIQLQSGDCLLAWDDNDCQGRSFGISEQMANTDELMSYAGFERRMKSISLCSSEESQSFHPIANSDWQIFDRLLKPTTIDKRDAEINFYDEPDFEGNIFTLTTSGGCYSFKSKWRNRISSLDASKPSLCVIAWDNLDCEGSSIRLELTTAASKNKNLKLVDFDKKIKSVNLCSQAQAEDDNGRAIPNPDDYRKLDINAIALEEHNKFRSQHGIDPLSSDEKLQSVAQTFADYLASSDKLYHSSDIQYGENLAGISTQNKETALKEAIQAWYNEISNYDFQNPRYSIRGLKAGHFTALVWKTTTKVGVGMAWNPKRRWWVVVANYSPPGNLKGTYAENVFPPVIL